MWAALIVMLILIVIHSKKKGGDTNTTDKIETQLQITKILFEIPDGQLLSWGHRQPLPTGANSSPASPVKLVLKNALLGVVDLDGLGWIWMDLDGLGWTWMDLDGPETPRWNSSVPASRIRRASRKPPRQSGCLRSPGEIIACVLVKTCRYVDMRMCGN